MEFRMDRNASGYYDGTAYKGMQRMAKAGEIWQYVNNSGYEQKYLIVKNNEKVCTALLLKDEDSVNSIEVAGLYTEPRMIQYIYSNNLTRCLDKITDDQMQGVLDAIRCNLGLDAVVEGAQACIDNESKEQAAVLDLDPRVIDEMIAVFGAPSVRIFCACAVYQNRCQGLTEKADWYLDKLVKLGGICGE